MKPNITVDHEQKMIIIKLSDNMDRSYIYETFDEVNELVNSPEYKEYTLLGDASEKGYRDLDSAMTLSENLDDLLKNSPVRMAYFRPQADFATEKSSLYPDNFKTFDNLDQAKEWLGH